MRRRHYLQWWYHYQQAGKTFFYVDESGFSPSSGREYGWADCGQKIYGFRSGERRPRTSLIAALCDKHLIAPMLFTGTCNTSIFNSWLDKSCRHISMKMRWLWSITPPSINPKKQNRLLKKQGQPCYSYHLIHHISCPSNKPSELSRKNEPIMQKYLSNKSSQRIINY